MSDIIVLKELSKEYRFKGNTVKALSHINLRISKGSFTSIIGQSGSGKSTLMNIIGFLDSPTYGHYYLNGVPVDRLSEKDLAFIRNQIIGFIFQGFNLIPSLNSFQNVELPLIYRGIKRKKRATLVKQALDSVGLGNRIYHKPNELSGGQQQRVAIARAIACQPEILLADEPTGNLDSNSGHDIMNIISELHKAGTTIILITHDIDVANMAENCIKISDGKIEY